MENASIIRNTVGEDLHARLAVGVASIKIIAAGSIEQHERSRNAWQQIESWDGCQFCHFPSVLPMLNKHQN